jgi:hypothetical protein
MAKALLSDKTPGGGERERPGITAQNEAKEQRDGERGPGESLPNQDASNERR